MLSLINILHGKAFNRSESIYLPQSIILSLINILHGKTFNRSESIYLPQSIILSFGHLNFTTLSLKIRLQEITFPLLL
jgi:hypothetical protein